MFGPIHNPLKIYSGNSNTEQFANSQKSSRNSIFWMFMSISFAGWNIQQSHLSWIELLTSKLCSILKLKKLRKSWLKNEWFDCSKLIGDKSCLQDETGISE